MACVRRISSLLPSLAHWHNLEGQITRLSKITMHYVNYEDAIVQRHGVKLVGWTYSRFINPADINGVADIWTLRDALRSGACHWIRLSNQELQDRKADVEARRERGEVVAKKRKERSDKGMKRKRHTTTDENDPDGGGNGAELAKKRRTAKTLAQRIPPKSRAIIEDDEDEEDTDTDVEAT